MEQKIEKQICGIPVEHFQIDFASGILLQDQEIQLNDPALVQTEFHGWD